MTNGKIPRDMHIMSNSRKRTLDKKRQLERLSMSKMRTRFSGFSSFRKRDRTPLPRSIFFRAVRQGHRKRFRGETHRTRFIKSVKPSGRLLDIGCGYGYFVAACREAGYDAEGTDVSEWAAQHAVENLNISVAVGKINDIRYDYKYFDIIIMWHFLEHSPDSHLVLRKIRTWLKRDGILVVDVPNYNGTDARYKWEGWVGWQLPYHYWHFTFNSLKLLLSQHGFRILKHKNYHSEVVKENLKRIPIAGLFARLIAKPYSGTSVAVIANL